MKFNVHAFKVPDRQWIIWIKNDPVDPYLTYFKLYTLNCSLTYALLYAVIWYGGTILNLISAGRI
jgi:hypothetical protein